MMVGWKNWVGVIAAVLAVYGVSLLLVVELGKLFT